MSEIEGILANALEGSVGSGPIRYIEMFGGVGGFRLGVESVGNDKSRPYSEWKRRCQCVGYYEWDKYAVRTYNRNFGEAWKPTDVTKLEAKDIPDFDLLTGGFPCQAFSIAGERRGFEDVRGTLFFEIARIAEAKRPPVLLLENVRGLLNHDGGRTFGTMLRALDDIGYDVQWGLCNSKYHGVPQNRERVYIVGHLRGQPRPQVFPLGEDAGPLQGLHGGEVRTIVEREGEGCVANCLTSRYAGYSNPADVERQKGCLVIERHRAHEFREYEGRSPTLMANTNGGGFHPPMVVSVQTPWIDKKAQNGTRFKEDGNSHTLDSTPLGIMVVGNLYDNGHDSQEGRVYSPEGIAPVMKSHGGNKAPTILQVNKKDMSVEPVEEWGTIMASEAKNGNNQRALYVPELKRICEIGGGGQGNRIYDPSGVSYTLASQAGGLGAKTGLYPINGVLRKLTPRECARLQGFPDWFEFSCSRINDFRVSEELCRILAQSMDVTGQLLNENICSASSTTRGGGGGEIRIRLMGSSQERSPFAPSVIGKLWLSDCAPGTTTPSESGETQPSPIGQRGNMGTSKPGHISLADTLCDKKVGEESSSIVKSLNVSLDESFDKKKWSIISTLIRQTIVPRISGYFQIEPSTISVTPLWNAWSQDSCEKDLSILRMENIVAQSDTQSYKQMGNAVTVNVVHDIAATLIPYLESLRTVGQKVGMVERL